jgi:general secretion pathway protein F
MPWFSYKAVSGSGEVIEGELEAADRSAVVERLRREGHVPIRAEALDGGTAGGAAAGGSVARRLRAQVAGSGESSGESGAAGARAGGRVEGRRVLGRGRVKAKEVAFMTRELAVLLDAGLTLDRALSILASLSGAGSGGGFGGGSRGGALRGVLERVLERVRGGSSLADALEGEGRVFPSFYAGMVRAGEAGGQLEAVLSRLAETLERAQALKESVVTALIYPALVVVLAVASLVVLMTLVIPEFRPLFEEAGAALPLLPRVILGLSDALRDFWWLPVAGLVVLVAGLRHYVSRPEGRLAWDRWLLGLPLFGDLLLKLEVARLTRTLGTLLANGVSVLNAFSMTLGTTQNQAIAEGLSELRGRVAKGEGLARPLAALGLFPALAVQLIEIGEESGRLEAMLLRVAEIYDEEVKRTLGRLLSLLVPLVTILLGGVIAVIIGAMLSAILSAYELPF